MRVVAVQSGRQFVEQRSRGGGLRDRRRRGRGGRAIGRRGGGGTAHAVEPVLLALRGGEHAVQHQGTHARRVVFGVGQRQRGAPRPTEQQPPVDLQEQTQGLDVAHEVRGAVGHQPRGWLRPTGAPLIEENDAVAPRVEPAPVVGRAAGTRTAMHEEGRCAAGVAALFPIHAVPVADFEPTLGMRQQRWVEARCGVVGSGALVQIVARSARGGVGGHAHGPPERCATGGRVARTVPLREVDSWVIGPSATAVGSEPHPGATGQGGCA